MTNREKEEFDFIVQDIVNNSYFRELDQELHHGISRYGHSYRVAKCVYKMTKRLGLRYVEATRAALLHDFYFDYQLEENTPIQNLVEHQDMAVLNASYYYDLSEMQKNMIASHMFPLCKTLPKYRESICLTLADKGIALYEQNRYKVSMKLGVYLLFILNMITLHK